MFCAPAQRDWTTSEDGCPDEGSDRDVQQPDRSTALDFDKEAPLNSAVSLDGDKEAPLHSPVSLDGDKEVPLHSPVSEEINENEEEGELKRLHKVHSSEAICLDDFAGSSAPMLRSAEVFGSAAPEDILDMTEEGDQLQRVDVEKTVRMQQQSSEPVYINELVTLPTETMSCSAPVLTPNKLDLVEYHEYAPIKLEGFVDESSYHSNLDSMDMGNCMMQEVQEMEPVSVSALEPYPVLDVSVFEQRSPDIGRVEQIEDDIKCMCVHEEVELDKLQMEFSEILREVEPELKLAEKQPEISNVELLQDITVPMTTEVPLMIPVKPEPKSTQAASESMITSAQERLESQDADVGQTAPFLMKDKTVAVGDPGSPLNTSRPGSASSLRGNAVPGLRPSSAKAPPPSAAQAEVKANKPKARLAPRLDLSHLDVEDVLAEIDVRVARLHQLKDDFENAGNDLAYLKATTGYGAHRCPERLRLIERMAKLNIVEIFRKIFRKYAKGSITHFLRDILVIHWNGTDASKVLCQAVIDSKVYEEILELMNDEYFSPSEILKFLPRKYLVKGLMGILNNTARLVDGAQAIFRECGGIQTIRKYRETKDSMVRCKTEIILSYLMTEKEYEETRADDSSIKFIMMLLEDALKSSDHQSKRYGFSVDETVEALNRIAVSDFNKPKILAHGGLEYYIKLMGADCSRQEQFLAARGVWILAFKCRDELLKDPDCLKAVQNLAATTTDGRVQKQAAGALWILEGRDQEIRHDTPSDLDKHDDDDDVPHVFISYQWSSQEIILKVRDRLKASGYKVWMDVESMSGSILEGMAKAVEKAAVVIICMSEKYKESPNCRTEAEYTFRLQKQIIPLRMQYRYQADGWLGALVGNKLFFDFSSENRFEKSVNGLIRELGSRGKPSARRSMSTFSDSVEGPSVIVPVQVPLTGAPPPNAITGAATWEVSQVADWLSKTSLKGNDWFSDVDGAMLMELRDIHQDAPEFFFTVVTRELNLPLKSLLRFTKSLKDLR